MEPHQENASSEEFGNVPNLSEGFGSFPNRAERKVNHILTVHSVARQFEEAGVARTERSITNWCQPDRNGVSRLDCYFDTNERKYYITPQSVERAIEEEKAKNISGELPKHSETFGNVPKPAESFRTVPHGSEAEAHTETSSHQHENAELTPEEKKELEELRVARRVWDFEKKFKDEWIRKLETEREAYVPRLVEQSRTIGYLEYKAESLEKENQQLLAAPTVSVPRIMEQEPHRDITDSEDDPAGETHEVVTDLH